MPWRHDHRYEAEPLEFLRLRLLADVDACHEQPEHDRHADYADMPGCWEGAQTREPEPSLSSGSPVPLRPAVALGFTPAPAVGCAPSQPPIPTERRAA